MIENTTLLWRPFIFCNDAYGKVRYRIRKAYRKGGFFAKAGVADEEHFPTQLEAIKWCNEYDRKLREM